MREEEGQQGKKRRTYLGPEARQLPANQPGIKNRKVGHTYLCIYIYIIHNTYGKLKNPEAKCR